MEPGKLGAISGQPREVGQIALKASSEVTVVRAKPKEGKPVMRDEIVGHGGVAAGKPSRDRVRVKVKKK
jgi:hypothetical protein